MFPTAIATWTTDLELFSGYQRLDNKLLPDNKIAYIGEEEYVFYYRSQISGVTSNYYRTKVWIDFRVRVSRQK